MFQSAQYMLIKDKAAFVSYARIAISRPELRIEKDGYAQP